MKKLLLTKEDVRQEFLERSKRVKPIIEAKEKALMEKQMRAHEEFMKEWNS